MGMEKKFSPISLIEMQNRRILPSPKVADRLTHEHFRWRRDVVIAVSSTHPHGVIHDDPHNFFFFFNGKDREKRDGKKKREAKQE